MLQFMVEDVQRESADLFNVPTKSVKNKQNKTKQNKNTWSIKQKHHISAILRNSLSVLETALFALLPRVN